MTRILSISHSAVVPEYRLRYRQIARDPEIELTVLTPERWRQFNRLCPSPPLAEGHRYALVRRQPWAWGLRGQGLRNASHLYPGLQRLIDAVDPEYLELWEEPFFAVSWQAIRAFRARRPDGPVAFFSAQNIPRRYPPPYRWFERYVYRHADLCMAMSEEVAGILRDRGWRGRSEILPLGVDPGKYDRAAEEAAGFRTMHALEGVVIGFLGRLGEEKGVLDLARAVARLPAASPVTLLYVGQGEADGAIRAAMADAPHRLVLAGGMEHAQTPRALCAMDIVVVPSRTTPRWKEQFGRVAVEAMAARAVAVTSDSGELPVVVGDAGRVVPEGDVEALAGCLRALVEQPALRRELAAAGRRRVEERYAWSVIAARQRDLYRELLESRTTRRPAP